MNIPKVRTWIVNYWRAGRVVKTCKVDTINKRFAYWMAQEQNGYPSRYADKVTVSLSKASRLRHAHN